MPKTTTQVIINIRKIDCFPSSSSWLSSTILAPRLSSPPPTPSSSITNNSKPIPLSSIESLLHGNSNMEKSNLPKYESPMAQVRSYVEKQMDQLQQDLEFGFPRAQKVAAPSSTSFLATAARVRLWRFLSISSLSARRMLDRCRSQSMSSLHRIHLPLLRRRRRSHSKSFFDRHWKSPNLLTMNLIEFHPIVPMVSKSILTSKSFTISSPTHHRDRCRTSSNDLFRTYRRVRPRLILSNGPWTNWRSMFRVHRHNHKWSTNNRRKSPFS